MLRERTVKNDGPVSPLPGRPSSRALWILPLDYGRGTACIVLAFLALSRAAAQEPVVPLCVGLTIVTAIDRAEGDYESIKTIQSADDKELRIRYASEVPNTDLLSTSTEEVLRYLIYRTVLIDDLRSAMQYQQVFIPDSDELIPDTTSLGASTAVQQSLRAGKETPFAYSNVPGDDYAGMTADKDVYPNYYSFFTPVTLQPVGRTTLSVLVNDRPTELPVIHARSEYLGEKSEFFFLDDDANPLTIMFRIGIDAIPAMDPALADTCAQLKASGTPMFQNMCLEEPADSARLRVIKITYRCEGSDQPAGGGSGAGGGGADGSGLGDGRGGGGNGEATALEQSLEEDGRAEVYSIYFEFNSAAIKEESRETLMEIAAVLGRRSDWRLSIEGHTDSIDSDEYNLDLSRRRAVAVKDALVSEYGVAPARLTAEGFGEARPVDTNETLEGRARNRRVELARLQ